MWKPKHFVIKNQVYHVLLCALYMRTGTAWVTGTIKLEVGDIHNLTQYAKKKLSCGEGQD